MSQFFRPVCLALLLAACGGGGSHAAEAPPRAAARDTATVCVFERNEARAVAAEVDPVGGDTIVEGGVSGRVYPRLPPPYGEEREWFRDRRPIMFGRGTYVAFGLPLAALPEDTRRVGDLDGIAVYARMDDSPETPAHLFVPLRPGCRLQTYNYSDESELRADGDRRF